MDILRLVILTVIVMYAAGVLCQVIDDKME